MQSVADAVRAIGATEVRRYRLRQCGGLGLVQVKRLKDLKAENRAAASRRSRIHARQDNLGRGGKEKCLSTADIIGRVRKYCRYGLGQHRSAKRRGLLGRGGEAGLILFSVFRPTCII